MADNKAMLNQIESLEKKIDAQISRAKTMQTTTLVIGVVLIVIIIGYFMFMAGQVRKMLVPQDLAEIAGDQIRTRVTELTPELEKAARENAPKLVDSLVNEVVDNQLPQGREALETAIKEESTRQLDRMETVLTDAFRQVVAQNEEGIRSMVETLKTDEGREEFQEAIQALMLEAINDGEIIVALDSYGIALQEVNALLGHLSTTPDADLTNEERITKQLIVVVREMANRSELELGTLPTLSGIDEAMEN